MDIQQFEGRKREHIQHAMDPANQASGLSGLAGIHLVHDALPGIDFSEVRLDSVCLAQPAPTPFYIAGMTAGHPQAAVLNTRLARSCAERGWAMGVGSQRRDLEDSDSQEWAAWQKLREELPRLVLFANLGITQLIHASGAKIREVVRSIGAQALAVHLNPLQEVLQPEGTPQFKGALEALRRICDELDVPVVLKETGCGFSEKTLQKLKGIRLAAIDVSGLGGTHWGRIEGARAEKESIQAAASRTFAEWGESTVQSVLAVRDVLPSVEVWASGGVRSGLDAAKLIALGAHRVGYAQPALEAALAGAEALEKWMKIQEYELRAALFCTDCATPSVLRIEERVWKRNGI